MKQSLRILMVLHMPWSRNLGGPRVQLELADEFQKMGHFVDKFDISDAFPDGGNSRFSRLLRPSFARKAIAFVKHNAHRFDIIDAHQGNLPCCKEELGFEGLLVARSVGLHAFCDKFAEFEKNQWPQHHKGNPVMNWIRSERRKRESLNDIRSFEYCDLINLPNADEKKYVQKAWGLGNKCVIFPFGLSKEREKKLFQEIKSPEIRLKNKQVVFIGYWMQRKGSRDWPEIIRKIKAKVSDARFLFLGTGLSESKVLQDLNVEPCDWIEVVPQFDSDELPKYLANCTVGAFPSYMEGFGFAVLEKMACGLPTVAYDIPGPRDMLKQLDTMVPTGDIEAFSNKIIEILDKDKAEYSSLSNHCLQVSKDYSWTIISQKHIEIYSKLLEL